MTHEGSNGTDRNPPSGTDGASKWHGGKGSSQRSVDRKKFDDNWDKIFGKKDNGKNNAGNDGKER